MNPLWRLVPQDLQCAFYNIQKLDLCSNMDISITAWINDCMVKWKRPAHDKDHKETLDYSNTLLHNFITEAHIVVDLLGNHVAY